MKEYIIVYTHHHQDLADEVNKYIAMGYSPVGNPYMAPDNKLSQAMLLTNRKDPEQPSIKVAKVAKSKPIKGDIK